MSVLVSFQDDELDESCPNEVDERCKAWMQRIGRLVDLENAKASAVVVVQNSSNQSIDESERMESNFVEMVVELQKRLGALSAKVEKNRMHKSARTAQNWDDWALTSAMEGGQSPKRQRTIGAQEDPTMLAEEAIPEHRGGEEDQCVRPTATDDAAATCAAPAMENMEATKEEGHVQDKNAMTDDGIKQDEKDEGIGNEVVADVSMGIASTVPEPMLTLDLEEPVGEFASFGHEENDATVTGPKNNGTQK